MSGNFRFSNFNSSPPTGLTKIAFLTLLILTALATGLTDSRPVQAAVYSCDEDGLNAGIAAGGLVQFNRPAQHHSKFHG